MQSYCIRSQGKDKDGKYKKLEGDTTVMFLRGCPASVEVTDLDALPLDYQSATVTMPASLLNDLLNTLEEDFRGKVTAEITDTLSRVADKRAIRHAIEVGIEVRGAELITGKTTLGSEVAMQAMGNLYRIGWNSPFTNKAGAATAALFSTSLPTPGL